MAAIVNPYYTAKRGDTLWAIANAHKDKISGNTIAKKIDTLCQINKIKDENLIHVDQQIKFSNTTSSSKSSTPAKSNKPKITGFNLKTTSTTGRDMYATWEHTYDNVKCYLCRWEEYDPDLKKWTAKNADSETQGADSRFCYSTYPADAASTKVRFRVKPVSKTYKSGNTEKPYWTNGEWSDVKTYDFADNPPLTPAVPTVKLDEIDDRKLVISCDNIEADALDAKYVQFNIVKNNTTSIHTSPNVTINTSTNYASYTYTIDYGAEYKVRVRSVSAKGKMSGWSDFCTAVGTKPVAPKKITQYYRKKRSDGAGGYTISAYLEWSAVTNATYYIVEYTTIKENFDTGVENWNEIQTTDARTSIEIIDIAAGSDYFFRVRSANANGESADTTAMVTIPIGEAPAAPTTWSSANSAFVGDIMELNWTHNSKDGSAQTWAQLSLNINDSGWTSFTFENATNSTTEEPTTETFMYGQAISYKGELHVALDTNNTSLKDAKIQWKVRTAGVTDEFSDTAWSVDRTIYIYAKPTLELSVTSDLAGTIPFEDVTVLADETGTESIVIRKALTTFPFYIRARVDLDSYKLQKPIGYHLRVVANDYYETVDEAGRSKTVNAGDAVYSKYFDTDAELIAIMSANNIDLEPLIGYTVYCDVDMSTGLSVSGEDEFNVYWADSEYTIRATIEVDKQTYVAAITPICEDSDGNLIENVTVSVYRREYNGTLTEIASDIPNDGTTITDPHPALDYARYRLIAKDTQTGAISFYDMPGQPVGCTSVIIQWDEAWSQFDTTDEYSVEAPPWTGSMLILPYNVNITDSRKRDTAVVAYAGREYGVSYHGTLIEEGSSWSTVIPKNDTETVYALRRLSIWAGPVYIREPSGMGFWANVVPSFNIDHDAVAIPVTLDVTRVEGGV